MEWGSFLVGLGVGLLSFMLANGFLEFWLATRALRRARIEAEKMDEFMIKHQIDGLKK